MKYIILGCMCILFLSCGAQTERQCTDEQEKQERKSLIAPDEMSIELRFLSLQNCNRIAQPESSFAQYLRELKLKPFDARVKFYDGSHKTTEDVYVSVIDMEIDAVDLQQCADAIMRLRAEYLYRQKRYDEIHFNFLSDGRARLYTEYAQGDYSYPKFRKYLRYIFAYANTASLHDELINVDDINEMQIGDVFIQKGHPYGHAVIVVDMLESHHDNKKYYLLAQSYMPAQETQILINPMNPEISPWYELKEQTIRTPEWTFQTGDLRRFAHR